MKITSNMKYTDSTTKPRRAVASKIDRSILSLEERIKACAVRREAMIDYANENALLEAASELDIPVSSVVEGLNQLSRKLQASAIRRGVPFSEIVKEILSGVTHTDEV